MLTRKGMPGEALIGYTPDLGQYACRGREIRNYLEQHFPDPGSRCCAVLDDMDEAGFQLPLNCRFFQTGEKRGLTRGVTQRIIDWFNEK